MGTLASELGDVAERLADRPRVYADANVPAGLVTFMRERLGWDVLFVLEDADLRRAPDAKHFRMAGKLRRTLVTLDRDYLDDRRFPSAEGGGILVLAAPDEPRLMRLLGRVNRALFQKPGAGGESDALPLLGRKLHAQADWTGAAPAERPERVFRSACRSKRRGQRAKGRRQRTKGTAGV